MKSQGRNLALTAMAVAAALAIQLLSAGVELPAGTVDVPAWSSWLLFFSTGRLVRFVPREQTPEPTQPQTPERPVFAPQEAAGVQIINYPEYDLDVEALLTQPLSWELTGDGPAVLILHSHGSESYENTEGYRQEGDYRTLDENYNMISIGDGVARQLEAAGIGVIHDRSIHDYPSYSGAYENARESIEYYLQLYPTICLVLDLHRDASQDSEGNQLGPTVTTELGESAKLMLVMGSPAGGQSHPNWEENLALGVKLQALLLRQAPGLCYEMRLRTSRFNQDLSPGALLVEVGTAGNTRQEALVAAQHLARAVIALAHGAGPLQ